MSRVIYSTLLAFLIGVFNLAQAANELTISIEQNTPLVSALTLNFVIDPNILWKDESGNDTALPKQVTTTVSTPFYGSNSDGSFNLRASYQLEEGDAPTDHSLLIAMQEDTCLVEGEPEIAFSTAKYHYLARATITSSERNNVKCTLLLMVEASSEPAPVVDVSIDNQTHISLVPSEPSTSTGTLTDGIVTLGRSPNNNTGCNANGFVDCATAAATLISAGNKTPHFVFTADPLNWILEGELRYIIQDPELTFLPEVIITLQNGASVLEQCVAQVSPPSQGSIHYQVETNTIDNRCEITLLRAREPLPNSPAMQIIIDNQLTRPAGESAYSYALTSPKVEVTHGMLNTTPTLIPADSTHTYTLSALHGEASSYQSSLYYAFDDYPMNTVPTGLHIILHNSEDEGINTWCQAAITGWNESSRLYQVNTDVSGDIANMICTITITSVDNPNTPISYALTQIDALPTEGIRQWEAFTIDNQTYLAAANASAKNSDYIAHNVFRFDRNTQRFAPLNNLLVGYRCVDSSYKEMFKDHVYAWQYFEVDGRKRLIMANHYSYPWKPGQVQQCDTSRIEYAAASYMYDWQNGDFNIGEGCCESLMTDSALMWEFYSHNNHSYLAAAEQGLNGQSRASLYQWSNGQFIKMSQPHLQVPSTQFIEAFTIDESSYLLFSPLEQNQEAQVYRTEADGQLTLHQGSRVSPQQVLAPQGDVLHSLVFSDQSHHFLLLSVANSYNNTVWLYRWEYVANQQRSLFVPYQVLPANVQGAHAWSTFTVGEKRFMAAALGFQGIVVYQWNSQLQQLETQHTYPVKHAAGFVTSLTAFTVEGAPALALAMQQDEQQNPRITSPILRWQAMGSK